MVCVLACGDVRPQTAEDLSLSAGIRVFYGASDLPVTRSYSDADSVFSSASVDDRPGVALGRVADRDGNSYEELLVGLPGYDGGLTDTGAISVVDLSSN